MLMWAVHGIVESRIERAKESKDTDILSVAVVGLLFASRAIDVLSSMWE